VARTFAIRQGVVRPSERDVHRLRVLGLMMLAGVCGAVALLLRLATQSVTLTPTQKPEPISKIRHRPKDRSGDDFC
jgi:hypothetical protein